jgi:hypothetical protein
MAMNGSDEDRIISQSVHLAANVRMPCGERMLDCLIIYANTVRAARKARFPPKCIASLEDDMIRGLEEFVRWTEWYRSPPRG